MRICPIGDLEQGMILGKSLFSETGQLLLRAGYPLDAEIIRVVRSTGRNALYVMEEGTEDILPEEAISEESRSKASAAFSRTISSITQAVAERSVAPNKLKTVIEKGVEFKNVVPVGVISEEVNSIVDEIMDSSSTILNQPLIKSAQGYNQEHAIDTTLIALLIARRLMYSRRDLLELGMAAFLHDLGKLALPELMNKLPSQYTEDDHYIMREHPVFGHKMFANSTDRYFLAQPGILYHHERQDGLGYPLGVKGTNQKPYVNDTPPTKAIFPFAEIIAVADAYDNLISGRKKPALSPEQAVTEIMRGSRNQFNAEVVKLLAEVISVFPTGSMVQIVECSGQGLQNHWACVMKPNSAKAHHPIVVVIRNADGRKITPRTVDLASESHVRLSMAH